MDIPCFCQKGFSIRGYAASKRGSTPEVSSIYPPSNELPQMEVPSYYRHCPYCVMRLKDAEAFVRDADPPFVQYQAAADANDEMRLPSPTPPEPDFTVPTHVRTGVLTAIEESLTPPKIRLPSPTPPEIRLPSPTPPGIRLPSPTPPDFAAPELEQATNTGGANEAPTEELIKSFTAKKTANRGHKRKRKLKSLADISVSDGHQNPRRKSVENTISKRDKGKAIATYGVVQPRGEGLYIGTAKEQMRNRFDDDVALPTGKKKGKQVQPEKVRKLIKRLPSPPGSKHQSKAGSKGKKSDTLHPQSDRLSTKRLFYLNETDPLQDKEDFLELDPKKKSSQQETHKDKQQLERKQHDSPTTAHRSSESTIGFPGIASHWMMRGYSGLTTSLGANGVQHGAGMFIQQNTLPSHIPSPNNLFLPPPSSLGSGFVQQHRGKTISNVKADEMKNSGPFPSYGNDNIISALQLMSSMDASSMIPRNQVSPASAQPHFGNDESPNFLVGSIFSGQYHRQDPMPNSPTSFQTLRPQSAALSGSTLSGQLHLVSNPLTTLMPHSSATLRPQSTDLSGQFHFMSPPTSLMPHSFPALSSGLVSFRNQ